MQGTARHASLVELCRARAQAHPARGYRFLRGDAVVEALSYGDLDRDARRIAVALGERGVRKGATVLVAHPPGLEQVRGFWGCLYAGAVAVLAPPPGGRGSARLEAIARDAGAEVVLDGESPAGDPSAWRDPGLTGDDLAVLQYTSGSTRAPRGVMLSHANLLHNLDMLRGFHLDQEHLVMLHWLPLTHDMGLVRGMLSPLHMGGDCVMMAPLDFAQRPLAWIRALSAHGATTTGAPNFGYELAARRAAGADLANLGGVDLSGLRVAFCSAEPIRLSTIDRFCAAFSPVGFRRAAFRPAYGLAEATVMVAGELGDGPRVHRVDRVGLREGRVLPGDHPLVSCGRPLGGQEVAIVGEDGGPCPPDRAGEIWLRGPSVARGYHGRPEETAAVFGARLDPAGERGGDGPWLRTGDLGWLGPDGDLCVVGRRSDLVIVRGGSHLAHELEATVEAASPGLRVGATVAFGVAVASEGTDGLVILAEPAGPGATVDVDAIRAAVSEDHGLALHALAVVARGEVPRTTSGKLQRARARRTWLDGGFTVLQAWRRAGFAWPDFAGLGLGAGDARDRLGAFLDELAAIAPAASEVLAALFPPAVAAALEPLAPRVHHVGLLAPAGLDLAGVEAALAASPFHLRRRSFASEIWAREVETRLGRPVEVTIVQAERAAGCGVEIFVAGLPAGDLATLFAEGAGGHVALALAPGASFADAGARARDAGAREPAAMLAGPATNQAIAARVLYLDVGTRRLEFIA